MIPAWSFICPTSELLPGEMRTGFDEVTGAAIVVFNIDGTLYALEDQCSHEEFALSAGDGFDAGAASVECVLHGARFDIRTGRPLCAPAYEPVARFPVKVENDGVWSRDDRD
ncbi:non-heme iron oxygenase ferredoxin subunit [Luteimonas deserti]|uniref:Non-heme iron oxygenase ferredoxin subunit n=1 Tax=Luteimonas deserti TaxID=2752306 RepID=A0A7Z0QRS6_9GAMM|nr:non-heme iron oxygenase ferredoxin subunit [Luteimonas deserti]NYZ63669.1 non-heme iron oxygenase ferredoxin subunit [Luteimonas deserti]